MPSGFMKPAMADEMHASYSSEDGMSESRSASGQVIPLGVLAPPHTVLRRSTPKAAVPRSALMDEAVTMTRGLYGCATGEDALMANHG